MGEYPVCAVSVFANELGIGLAVDPDSRVDHGDRDARAVDSCHMELVDIYQCRVVGALRGLVRVFVAVAVTDAEDQRAVVVEVDLDRVG